MVTVFSAFSFSRISVACGSKRAAAQEERGAQPRGNPPRQPPAPDARQPSTRDPELLNPQPSDLGDRLVELHLLGNEGDVGLCDGG